MSLNEEKLFKTYDEQKKDKERSSKKHLEYSLLLDKINEAKNLIPNRFKNNGWK